MTASMNASKDESCPRYLRPVIGQTGGGDPQGGRGQRQAPGSLLPPVPRSSDRPVTAQRQLNPRPAGRTISLRPRLQEQTKKKKRGKGPPGFCGSCEATPGTPVMKANLPCFPRTSLPHPLRAASGTHTVRGKMKLQRPRATVPARQAAHGACQLLQGHRHFDAT